MFSQLCLRGALITNFLIGCLLCSSLACSAPMKPLVVNSEMESPFPKDASPDVTTSDRAMLSKEATTTDMTISDEAHEDEPFQGPMENRRAESFWQRVGDIIGFPVRAAGWVIQSIF